MTNKITNIFKGPASEMTGMELKGGWIVSDIIEPDKTHTGGAYSVCYRVEKDDQQYFLKAFDIEAYLKGDKNPDIRLKEMGRMIKQYEYEKNLSEFCRDKGVTKVACVIDGDVTNIDNNATPIPYLIFERADGDVRKFMESITNVDNAWKFKSLHDVAVGLDQLHRIDVYHQDVKPSNILTFGNNSKIGDLGRAVRRLADCPFFEERYWGDKTYMAPEIAYTSGIEKDERRMLLTDLYLLGSLITFYFVGTPFNGLLYKRIAEDRHFQNSSLTYSEILEELKEAYELVIESLQSSIRFGDRDAEGKLIELIKGLCNPDIDRRYHPKSGALRFIKMKYGLERVISTLDILHRKFKYKLRS